MASEFPSDPQPGSPVPEPAVQAEVRGGGESAPSQAETDAATDAAVQHAMGKPASRQDAFIDNFVRRFFVRGLAALMPTLITLWLLAWLWNFLWTSIGQYVIFGIRLAWYHLSKAGLVDPTSSGEIRKRLSDDDILVRLLGVGVAIILVYLVGILVGNLIGRSFYRLAERALIRIPLIRAIYPAVKQVTDFVLAEKKTPITSSRVVAVQARAQGIWSIGFVTGQGYGPINEATRGDMLTIFIPSTPTAFAGYVVVAHREATVELPLTVEETMRLLVSGGVIVPHHPGKGTAKGGAADSAGGVPANPSFGSGGDLPADMLPANATFVSSPQELARLTGGRDLRR